MIINYPMYYYIPVVPTRMFDENEDEIQRYEQMLRSEFGYNDIFREIDEEYVNSKI